MKRTRHKRTPSVRRRALEFIAAHPDGCTEALLAANIPADILIELVQSGLVIARNERSRTGIVGRVGDDACVDRRRREERTETAERRAGWKSAEGKEKKSPAREAEL